MSIFNIRWSLHVSTRVSHVYSCFLRGREKTSIFCSSSFAFDFSINTGFFLIKKQKIKNKEASRFASSVKLCCYIYLSVVGWQRSSIPCLNLQALLMVLILFPRVRRCCFKNTTQSCLFKLWPKCYI